MTFFLLVLLVGLVLSWCASLGHLEEVANLKEALLASEKLHDDEVRLLADMYDKQSKGLRDEIEYLRKRLG